MERGLCGVKPDTFCVWIFEMLNLQPGDSFFDLFEGSGAVTRAFRRWVARASASDPCKRACVPSIRQAGQEGVPPPSGLA